MCFLIMGLAWALKDLIYGGRTKQRETLVCPSAVHLIDIHLVKHQERFFALRGFSCLLMFSIQKFLNLILSHILYCLYFSFVFKTSFPNQTSWNFSCVCVCVYARVRARAHAQVSLCIPGCSGLGRTTCLCLLSAGTDDAHYSDLARFRSLMLMCLVFSGYFELSYIHGVR